MLANEAQRRIGKVARYHLWLFLLPVLSILFYAWLQAPELNERADNPQRLAPLSKRGRLLDRRGLPLAVSVGDKRVYPLKEVGGSLIGYQLLGRNQTGLESALQSDLSPPLPPSTLRQALLQDREVTTGVRTRLVGPDLTLTLSVDLESKLYDLLSSYPGALVVANSEGQILAAVSLPSYDPNRVREQWQKLQNDERGPFVERVGSGLYPVMNPQGKPLLIEQANPKNPWFDSDPFPNYPNSSAAAWSDHRLLLSPLMLLEASYGIDSAEPAPDLTLLMTRRQPPRRSPLPFQLSFTPESGGLKICRLQGPPFKDSSSFLASYGVNKEGVHFALVVESTDPAAQQIVGRCLATLATVKPNGDSP